MSSTAGGNYYEYPNGVLRNKFGITDASQLQQIEATTVAFRLLELGVQPLSGAFDFAQLKAIHQHLFQDIYVWAGEVRQVDISKGTSRFAHFGYIVSNATTLFAQLAAERFLTGLAPDLFASRAAYFLGEMNVLHPFREGNGRTQRVFFTDLARGAGYMLNWDQITPQQMIDASILSLMRGDNSVFEQIFLTILTHPQP